MVSEKIIAAYSPKIVDKPDTTWMLRQMVRYRSLEAAGAIWDNDLLVVYGENPNKAPKDMEDVRVDTNT